MLRTPAAQNCVNAMRTINNCYKPMQIKSLKCNLITVIYQLFSIETNLYIFFSPLISSLVYLRPLTIAVIDSFSSALTTEQES